MAEYSFDSLIEWAMGENAFRRKTRTGENVCGIRMGKWNVVFFSFLGDKKVR
jgi:hypothetical protein